MYLVPFTIMLTSSILIGHQMITQKKRLQLNKKKFEKEKQLIKTLVIMDVYFLVYILYFDLVI